MELRQAKGQRLSRSLSLYTRLRVLEPTSLGSVNVFSLRKFTNCDILVHFPVPEDEMKALVLALGLALTSIIPAGQAVAAPASPAALAAPPVYSVTDLGAIPRTST